MLQRIDIAFLTDRLAFDLFSAVGKGDNIVRKLQNKLRVALTREVDSITNPSSVYLLILADEHKQLFNHILRNRRVFFFARDQYIFSIAAYARSCLRFNHL